MDELRQSVAWILGAGKLPPIRGMPEPTEEDLDRRYRISLIGGKVYTEEVEN